MAMRDIEQSGFDWGALDEPTKVLVRELDAELDQVLKRTSKEIGLILLKAKRVLPHGKFQSWHFSKGISQNMAWRCMQVAQGKEIKSSVLDDLPKSLTNIHGDIVSVNGQGLTEGGASLAGYRGYDRWQEAQSWEEKRREIEPSPDGVAFFTQWQRDNLALGLDRFGDILPSHDEDGTPSEERGIPPQFFHDVVPTESVARRNVDNIPIAVPHISSKNNEWYTPEKYIQAAREVMGGIDLDPASCAQANETVQATKYYDIQTNGFDKDWEGRVWLNPPYGRSEDGSNQDAWSSRLIDQYEDGNGVTTEAILLVNAAVDTKWFQRLFNYPICFPSQRINFSTPEPSVSGSTHGSALVYFGPHEKRFVEVFSRFGTVVRRWQ